MVPTAIPITAPGSLLSARGATTMGLLGVAATLLVGVGVEGAGVPVGRVVVDGVPVGRVVVDGVPVGRVVVGGVAV